MCDWLADIGNSSAKLFDGENIVRLAKEELIHYKDARIAYVCVDTQLIPQLRHFRRWIDIAAYAEVAGSYATMGEDRRVLCSYIKDGIIVDAGSAITVDVMRNGFYQGGFLYPGVRAMERAYAAISSRLECEIKDALPQLAKDTCAQIRYGALVPLVRHIATLGEPIYLTGGDAKLLAKFLPQAKVEPKLLFTAMQHIITRKGLC